MPAKPFRFNSHIYFDELDALGVLHHSRYLHHLERGQQAFFEHLLGVDDFNPERDEDIYVVVHSIDIRFREPIRSPGPVLVTLTIRRIRAGGVTMDFAITSPDEANRYCSGSRTVCKLSGITHSPTEWTSGFSRAMEQFNLPL